MQIRKIAELTDPLEFWLFVLFIIMIICRALLRRGGLLEKSLLMSRPAYFGHRKRPKGNMGNQNPKDPKIPQDPKIIPPESTEPKQKPSEPEQAPPKLDSTPPPPPQPKPPRNPDPYVHFQQSMQKLNAEVQGLMARSDRILQKYEILKSNELPHIQNMMKTKAMEEVPNRLKELKSKANTLGIELTQEHHRIMRENVKIEDLHEKTDLIASNTKVVIKIITMAMNDIEFDLMSLQGAAEAINEKITNNPYQFIDKPRKKWRHERLEKQRENLAEQDEKSKSKMDKLKEDYKEFMGDTPNQGLWKSTYNFFSDAFHNSMRVLKDIKFNPLYLIAFAVLYAIYPKQTAYSEKQFESMLRQGKISHLKLVTYKSSKSQQKIFEFDIIDGTKGSYYSSDPELTLQKLKHQFPNLIISPDEKLSWSLVAKQSHHLLFGLFGLANILYIAYSLKKMGKGGASRGADSGLAFNKQKFDMNKHVKVRFTDVAGLEQSKLEIQEFVDFLKNPKKYEELGARIPKGALLTGPPGTGKTMLAKATAGEAGVPFFFVSGSDFVQMFVGLGAARVRDLFKQAKANSPAIIFIDEIDAIGKKRDSGLGSNDERDGTLNQLLVEMDGFGTDAKVIVMAATNRTELLDNALTRPGRLDRMIEVNLPDLAGRKDIFMVHLRPLKLSTVRPIEEYARRLATLTPGFSGADIANLCNEAAIVAARANKEVVEPIDFEMATQRIIGGLEKRSIMSEDERKVVAVHQSGHAVVSWFLEGAYPLLKLTIIPRSKGSLGFAQYLPSQTRLQTKQQLLDRICFILGGRCSELHFFKRITTGASDDLDKAYKIAHALVTKYGMSEKLGFIGYRQTEYMKPYSVKVNKVIDQEIKLIIDRCTEITKGMIAKHEKDIKNLSDELLKRETLDGKQIRAILGQRPFKPHSSYKAYLEMQQQQLQKIDKPQPSVSP